MKAVVFREHGGGNVLSYENIPDPKPGPGEVLVKLKAASLNHLDIWVRQGLPGLKLPFPHIPGSDGAGILDSTGPGVGGLEPGDRVVISPGMGCGTCHYCVQHEDSLCEGYKLLGLQLKGTYAQKIVVPAKRVIKVSDVLSFEEWASIPLVFLTAWHMLHTHAGMKSTDKVLVHAAGSGIGHAAIQIAKASGAFVFTTVGSKEKVKKAKALGADEVIDYRQKDFSEVILKRTKEQGVDVVFEHVGPATWSGSLSCLARGGRLVTCGATTGAKVEVDLRFLFMKQQSLIGSYMGGLEELKQVMLLVEKRNFKPIVDKVFYLKDASKAQEHMESRRNFGKIVLKIPS